MALNLYRNCRLCPRGCGVDRIEGKTGFCGASAKIEAGRAGLHFWEEPVLSGKNGSGTVFFVHCTLGCVFCQNRMISRKTGSGTTLTAEQLAEVYLSLEEQGAHNINLVTATHYAPDVARSIVLARDQGLRIPFVLNSGGYEKVETLQMLEGLIQIYLPDYKYYSSYYAGMYSAAPDYFEVADAAIEEMVRQTGAPVYDAQGLLQRGTIIRHLMLPGLSGDTKQVLRHIAERWGETVLVSLMRQYTPIAMEQYPELNHKVTDADYEEATQWFMEMGLSGFFQDAESIDESFIPSFRGEGLQTDKMQKTMVDSTK